jgi:hypothetical protein
MTIENGNYLNDLNENKPYQLDFINEAPLILNLIKKVIKKQFKNFKTTDENGNPVFYSDEDLNNMAKYLTANKSYMQMQGDTYFPSNFDLRNKYLVYEDDGKVKPQQALPSIGSIKFYLLDSLDAIYGTNQTYLVPCDGREITGSLYAEKILGGGEQYAPDIRGRFVRMYNDPASDALAPAVPILGERQLHSTAVKRLQVTPPRQDYNYLKEKNLTHNHNAENHIHSTPATDIYSYGSGNYTESPRLTNYFGISDTAFFYKASYSKAVTGPPDTNITDDDINHAHFFEESDLETRPHSMVGNYWIRIN